uniref:PH domain-containing protein n=1 Tax=Herbidospora sakaeratensis TaxID=564415 RepID=UPI0007826BE9|nr:PH domain-containing protein [Herbidospora sakaeratensis]
MSAVALDDAGWQRLNSRVAWVDLGKMVVTFIPSVVAAVVFDQGLQAWPVFIVTGLGVVSSVLDLKRWMHTRYRVGADRMEIRKGWLIRRYRSVPRDRIRTVDTSAKLRHRLAGLRVVHISSGEARTSFKLDALESRTAERLRADLLGVTPAVETAEVKAEETVLARLRWSWFVYNIVSVWAFLVSGLLLLSAYLTMQTFGVDLREVIAGAVDWRSLGLGWTIVVATAGCFVLGTFGMALNYLREKANFRLVRTRTDDGTALLTRQGMFRIREVYRDDRRLRGVAISEPLLSRWLRLAETEVVSTGLSWTPGSDAAAAILPRTSVAEARRVAALVLGDEHRPLDAPLRRHPRPALRRRLVWAGYVPGVPAALLAWLGATGAVPGWIWAVPAGLIPVACLLAVVAYRSLGHAMAGPYLVMRSGLIRRTTVVLQSRGVIGWGVRQSLLQRRLGLATLRVQTAAGNRVYEVPDIAAGEAAAFAHAATPVILAPILAEGAAEAVSDPQPDGQEAHIAHDPAHG